MTVLLGEADSLCSDSLILFHPLQTLCLLPLAFPWCCELLRNGRQTSADSSVAQKLHVRVLHSTASAACRDLRRGRGGPERAVRLCSCHREQTGATAWVCVSVLASPKMHTNTRQRGCARVQSHTRTNRHSHTGSCLLNWHN